MVAAKQSELKINQQATLGTDAFDLRKKSPTIQKPYVISKDLFSRN